MGFSNATPQMFPFRGLWNQAFSLYEKAQPSIPESRRSVSCFQNSCNSAYNGVELRGGGKKKKTEMLLQVIPSKYGKRKKVCSIQLTSSSLEKFLGMAVRKQKTWKIPKDNK